ncbi:MAG: four helix bundle protein [Pirellulales bacterium]|nr:four helix bundle protein [Pirellulales bacterium]
MGARNYQDLIAWQKAMDFAEKVYDLSQRFPSEERFSLTAQLRRSATSVPSNIAEGEGRFSKPDFNRFLSIAHGSLREAETQILLAIRLQYVKENDAEPALAIARETGKLIQRLARPLDKT